MVSRESRQTRPTTENNPRRAIRRGRLQANAGERDEPAESHQGAGNSRIRPLFRTTRVRRTHLDCYSGRSQQSFRATRCPLLMLSIRLARGRVVDSDLVDGASKFEAFASSAPPDKHPKAGCVLTRRDVATKQPLSDRPFR